MGSPIDGSGAAADFESKAHDHRQSPGESLTNEWLFRPAGCFDHDPRQLIPGQDTSPMREWKLICWQSDRFVYIPVVTHQAPPSQHQYWRWRRLVSLSCALFLAKFAVTRSISLFEPSWDSMFRFDLEHSLHQADTSISSTAYGPNLNWWMQKRNIQRVALHQTHSRILRSQLTRQILVWLWAKTLSFWPTQPYRWLPMYTKKTIKSIAMTLLTLISPLLKRWAYSYSHQPKNAPNILMRLLVLLDLHVFCEATLINGYKMIVDPYDAVGERFIGTVNLSPRP